MTNISKSEKIPLVYQEPEWLAVDKPPGLSVHNDEDPTNLIKLLSIQLSVQKIFPVHRLDKETSGVQILALSESAASWLAQQFQNHEVQKFYSGIVAGQVPEKGTWNLPLSDKAEGAKNPAGNVQDRKPCETKYRVLRQSKYFSWLEFEILTGRQHQIRKHCALAGRALVGDLRYGNPKYFTKIREIYNFDRMALHCSEIRLKDSKVLKAAVPREFSLLFPDEKI